MAAIESGVSKSALMGWESGRFRPRGPGLARLLGVLETEPRLRARLLHDADPAHARIALCDAALGAPVDLGAVLRAMRLRRGTTQAELARAAGVTQATVARWESGDAVPSGATLHTVAFALGASAEEAVALACAQGGSSGTLPGEPPAHIDFDDPFSMQWRNAPAHLREIVHLGMEAELWPRAVRDPRWDALLADVIGRRAVQHFLNGRHREAEETARRALRLAATPEVRLAQTSAFSALLEVATHRGAEPGALAVRIEAWAAKLPDGGIKGWMLWEQALRLAEMDRAEEAVALNERMAEFSLASGCGEQDVARHRDGGLLEIELRAGRTDRAEALLPDYVGHGTYDVPRRRVRIAHARGEAADEALIEEMRAEDLGAYDSDNWYTRHKIDRIEREQARRARNGRPATPRRTSCRR